MKLIKMVREVPEVAGGPVKCKIQIQDRAALEARGWKQDGDEFEVKTPEEEKKAALVAKALELELKTVEDLAPMSSEEIEALLADEIGNIAPGGNVDEKASLIARALALKESNPKQVKASPSAIPAMSVEKLSKLIADAEAAIAAGNQD